MHNEFRNRGLAVFGWLLIVVLAGLTGVSSVIQVVEASLWVALVVLALGTGICWLLYRFTIRPAVVVAPSGVIVRNPLTTIELAWQDIERFEAALILFVVRRDGSHVPAWAVGAAPAARILGRESVADRVADTLNQHLATALGLPSSQVPRRIQSEEQRAAVRRRAIVLVVVVAIAALVQTQCS